MRLFVDLATLGLVQGPYNRVPLATVPRFKRGDGPVLEVVFLDADGPGAVEIGDPETLELEFGLKTQGAFGDGYLAHATDWTMPETGAVAPVYTCTPNLSTLELDAVLDLGEAAELTQVLLMGELTWREGAGSPTSTRTFSVVVENDVNRGTETAPEGYINTNLPATDVGKALLTLPDDESVGFPRINADNTATKRTAAELLDDIGAQPAGDYVLDNDARLSDARTPTAHTHAVADLTDPENLSLTASQIVDQENLFISVAQLSDPESLSVNSSQLLDSTAVGRGLLTLTNPDAVTFPRFNADNTTTPRSASDFRADIAAVGLSGNETVAGNKTLSGQLELTGQSASSQTSAMTRGLWAAHAHFTRDLFRNATLNASGASAVARRTTAAFQIIDGDISAATAASGHYVRAQFMASPGSLDSAPGARTVSLQRSWLLMVRVALTMPNNLEWLLGVGADATSGVPSSGNVVGVQFTNATTARLWRNNNGAAVFSNTGTLTNIQTSTYNQSHWHYIWLESTGSGTVNLYVASSALGASAAAKPTSPLCTLAGCPTEASTAPIACLLRATGSMTGSVSGVMFVSDARFIEL